MSSPIILITGFSGAGKTTIWKELLNQHPKQIVRIPNNTTRAAREGEIPGVDYHFLTEEEFHRKREAGEFLESSEHMGSWYASTHPEAFKLEPDQIPLYTIDPVASVKLKQQFPHMELFFVYISPEEQYRRLTSFRGETLSPQQLQSRIARYEQEHNVLEANREHFHVLRNETIEDLTNAVEYIQRKLSLG